MKIRTPGSYIIYWLNLMQNALVMTQCKL